MTSAEELEEAMATDAGKIIAHFRDVHEAIREALANRDQIYISKYEKSIGGLDKTAPENLEAGDLVLIKQRKAGGLRLPLMGPFRFIQYRGQKRTFATVENVLNGK